MYICYKAACSDHAPPDLQQSACDVLKIENLSESMTLKAVA